VYQLTLDGSPDPGHHTPMLLRRTLRTAALALLLVPSVASAQGTDADRTTARTLAREGQAALDHHDFTAAADRFKRADGLAHGPAIALGLARAQVGLGQWIAAHETFARILREGAPRGAPPAESKAVAEAQVESDVLDTRIPGVMVQVQGPGAATAKTSLDGAPLPKGAYWAYQLVDPGPHTFRAEAEGFAPAETSMTIPEHHQEIIKLTLDHQTGPAAPSQLATPESVAPPAPHEELLKPAPTFGTRDTVGLVLINVGAVLVVTGSIAAGVAAQRHGAGPTGEAMVALSVVGLVGGTALAVAGTVLFVTPAKQDPPKAAWAAPFVGAGRVGITGGF
jgi:Tetratricopeptide repeat